MLFVPLVLAAAGAYPGAQARTAAALQMRGEVAAARTQIDAVLSHDPDDPSALFVGACMDVEEGGLEEAAARTSRLAMSPAGRAHAHVLAALIERRRQSAPEPLRESLVEAWKRAGRPDLSATQLPGLADLDESLDSFPVLSSEREALLTPGERLLFRWGPADKSERLELAIAAAALPRQNSRVVNLEVLSVLALLAPFAPARAAAADQAARSVGRAVVESDPDNGYFRVAAWAAGGSSKQPLTSGDIDLLHDALARPRLEVPRAELLVELRTLAGRWDPEHAGVWAASASLGLANAASILRQRFDATPWTTPANRVLRSRASSVLLGIGDRLASSRTIVDRMSAFALMSSAAKDGGDPEAALASKRRIDAFRAWYREVTATQKRLGSWPLAAWWREWTPDEIGYFGLFRSSD